MVKNELIGKIKALRQIKPSQDWVVLTKKQLLGQEEPKFGFIEVLRFMSQPKPALAGILSVLIVFGFLAVAKNSLPGDPLYIVRKVAHKAEAIFVSSEQKPAFQLKLANERLEDLTRAQVKNLAPTINEFQASLAEAARNLSSLEATTSDAVAMKKLVEETKRLEENKHKVESLGVVIGQEGTNELESALARVVANLIEDLAGRTLDEEKTKTLSRIKELFEKERYSDALETFLLSQ